MPKRKAAEIDGNGDARAGPPALPEGQPATVGQQTSHIANKQVRSQQYHKLKHEKNKKKKSERKRRQREAAKADELGLPPPPKMEPKVSGPLKNCREDRSAMGGNAEEKKVQSGSGFHHFLYLEICFLFAAPRTPCCGCVPFLLLISIRTILIDLYNAIPQTIENQRIRDETEVAPGDEEVNADEATDEFAAHFAGDRPPHVLITTSYKPSKPMYAFLSEMLEVLPRATYYKRQGYPLKKICKYASERGFTDVMVFNEDRKNINGLLLVHLPDGPTARFRLSSLKLGKDIQGHGRATTHKPELVLNNFDTRLGHRLGRMFASLFDQQPTFKGRRVVTFHNQRDFVFFRHHRYIFEEKDVKQRNSSGSNGKPTVKVNKQVKARLQELGPRFTLKLDALQAGMFDTKGGEFEWVQKKKDKGDKSRRKFAL
jgi:ribosome production factor 1